MTITYTGLVNQATDTITNFKQFNPASYTLVDASVQKDGREYLFQKIDEDPSLPITVRIGIYTTASEGVVNYNCSIRKNYYISRDDLGDDIVSKPASVVLAWTLPWAPVLDEVQHLSQITEMLSWAAPNVASDVLDDDILAMLKYSVYLNTLADVTRT